MSPGPGRRDWKAGRPRLGPYVLLAGRGHDGNADVYLALRGDAPVYESLVILRTLRPELARDPALRSDFLEEGKQGTPLDHPNCVRTFEMVEEQGTIGIATEYLEGQLVHIVTRAARKANVRIDPDWSTRIISDALAGLHYAHELKDERGAPRGIVHRNVSPRTIFITYDGITKLIDFGSSKGEGSPQESEEGALQMRVAYMAPEQVSGVGVDRRADVFAMGIVFWELLTGQRLMARENATTTLQRILHEPSVAPSQVAPGIDGELDAIVLKALDRDPTRRFQSADEMHVALEARLFRRGVRADAVATQMRTLFLGYRERARAEVEQLLPRLTALPVRPPPPPMPQGETIEAWRELVPNVPPPEPPPPPPPGMSATAIASISGGGLLVLGLSAFFAWKVVHKDPPPPPPPDPPPPAIVYDEVLRLHGSNVIGADLAPALAEAFLKKRGATDVQRRAGAAPEEILVTGMVDGKGQSVEIDSRGTETEFEDLKAGKCDVGLASRPIRPEEADALKALGDLTQPASEHFIGLDAIALLVHANNPLRTIDTVQLHDAFTGKLADWSALGVRAGTIDLYAPVDRSGTIDIFRHEILGQDAISPNAKRIAENGPLVKAVTADPNALGLASFRSVASAEALAVGDPGANPLYPSPFTVATEDYPFTRRLYLYTAAKPARPLSTEFVKFVLSAEGQKVVKETGFVDLTVRISDPGPCAGKCPPRYLAISKRARRLSLTFRFRSASAEFDARSLSDVDRLVDLLKTLPDPHVLLVGFADISGDPAASLALSKERARKVNDQLVEHGIHAALMDGFGLEMPRASNATEAGRERNRRVEVWLDK
jgi:phosphate transport system substrate-binding protein